MVFRSAIYAPVNVETIKERKAKEEFWNTLNECVSEVQDDGRATGERHERNGRQHVRKARGRVGSIKNTCKVTWRRAEDTTGSNNQLLTTLRIRNQKNE